MFFLSTGCTHTARYSLLVLKVPLSTNQPLQQRVK